MIFIKKAISEIQKRLTFEDPTFEIIEPVKPVNARKLIPPSVDKVFDRYPILNDVCDIESA